VVPFSTPEMLENIQLVNEYRERSWADPRFLRATEADREQVERDRQAKLEMLRVEWARGEQKSLPTRIERLRALHAQGVQQLGEERTPGSRCRDVENLVVVQAMFLQQVDIA